MKSLFKLTCVVLMSFLSTFANAQQSSPNKVKYMITFEGGKSLYTAWVVPSYSTPNFNNPDTEEKGATAQFSLKVPNGFVISSFKSLKGNWEGYNSKIGNEPYFKEAGLDTGYEYYILGKAPTETNYGHFESGEPIALFSFTGNTMRSGEVAVVENEDEFVDIAYNKLSLNVAASFYSKSGQKAQVDSRPLEQFYSKIDLGTVVKEAAEKLGATESLLLEENDPSKNVLVYPNPSDSIVNLKYFSLQEGGNAQIELYDQNGSVLKSKDELAKRGFNTTQLDIQNLIGGTYLLRTVIANNIITKKVIKIN
jgi:hypothetical protein